MANTNDSKAQQVTIQSTINAPVEKVWQYFSDPAHIVVWNSASDDWHTPRADNDLRVGGKFSSRMEAKDGSMGFDFTGEYTEVKQHQRIAYVMTDGRKVSVDFRQNDNSTEIVETFDAEDTNPVDMQKAGWQSILDNFKKYVESKA